MHGFARSLVLVAAAFPAAALAQDAGKSPPPSVPELVLQLSAKDAAARRDACIALKTRWPDAARAVPALIEVADDDESADVKKAAVESLSALGNEGGKSFAAWVKGVSAEEKAGIGRLLSSIGALGPAVTPRDWWGTYAERVGPGWPLVLASLAGGWSADIDSAAPSVSALGDKDARARAAATAALGVHARRTATRYGAPTSGAASWLAAALSLHDGDWAEGQWMALGIFGHLIPSEARAREKLLAAVTSPAPRAVDEIWEVLARTGTVPPATADAWVATTDPMTVLRYGRGLGLLDAVARGWAAAEGEDAVAKRWLAKCAGSEDPLIAALFRHAERDPEDSERGDFAKWLVVVAGFAGTTDVASLLAFDAESLQKGASAPRRLRLYPEACVAAARALAALALLDVTHRHPGATKTLIELLASEDPVAKYLAKRVVRTLGPEAVEIPADARSGDEASSDDPLDAAARGGEDAVRAVPRLVELSVKCRDIVKIGWIAPYDPIAADHLAAVLRALGRIGPPASAALPELRKHLTYPDARMAHIARTAIRRIEAK